MHVVRTSMPSRGARSFALTLAIALLALSGCKKEEKVVVVPPPPEVVVAPPVEREVTRYITYTGTIEASEVVELRARIQGFLEKINFRPGQAVKKGDLLFVIDKREYEAEVAQAKAFVMVEEARLVGAQNDARLARELADQKAGPEIDAIIKAARRDSAAADVVKAKSMVDSAELKLSFCDVFAPIDGRITENFVDTGDLVGRADATLLATIVQSMPSYVGVDVSESDILAIRADMVKSGAARPSEPGQVAAGGWRPAELALANETEFKMQGRVDYVEPRLNATTGTLRVRTLWENKDNALLPGYFARIRFPMSKGKALLTPDAALLTDQLGRYALVVNSENTVESRRVKLGASEGPLRVVEEGLTATDRVVVLGVQKARPGVKVTPMTEEEYAKTDKARRDKGQAEKASREKAAEQNAEKHGKSEKSEKPDQPPAGGR